ncbi:hypothetical protein V0R48_18455 [Pseudomonas alcaligenes]|jgi:hypothetical protein|uniref:hypothetical protein n=1 Tax=Aquipseudomonas alcaligenes TaxID=43263 RepID=UPI002E7ADF9E|nr:hypothetical protein [Pseudomonas alcaligenes]MEE1950966.1 hypothetical protein [Pseudomonas alcaligenes]
MTTKTGSRTQENIRSLLGEPARRQGLKTLDPVGAWPASRGRKDFERKAGMGGTGVAWPLTEQDYSTRAYWPKGEASSDGLFFFPAIRTLVLTDAEGRTGSVYLAQPPEITP